jgi:flagellar M-ring protein FliF
MNFFNGLNRKILLAMGIAAVIAVMVAFWLWSQEPKYRVLFSNYSNKDGGAIVAVLEQMNIPYKISDSGAAMMVPADQVHMLRLKLAALGLPKGGNVGFELLENQRFGVSQFVEQVNYQRALVGELERSIQAISVVENARVHLAIPKATVFLRDQQRPTASILLKLQPGRTLEPQQVSAIIHLIASSVPNLPTENVSVVDQNGELLSDVNKKNRANQVDPSQLKYIEDLQRSIVTRVVAIITPIVGAQNVQAQASAEIDFATQEQAEETYRPNKKSDNAVIRSEQTNESSNASQSGASGVPGALSNQPGVSATAPLSTDPNGPVGGTDPGAVPATTPTQKNVTVNYEVDKTVKYTQKTTGGIKRLTVAVVVNEKQELDKEGKNINRLLTDEEKKQITDLAKQAMGFNEERGDSLSVVHAAFAPVRVQELGEIPVWQNSTYIEMAKDAAKLMLGLVVLLMLYKKALKPLVVKLLATTPAITNVLQADASVQSIESEQTLQIPQQGYQLNLQQAKLLAKENPKMVANVVTSWVSGNG